MLPRYDSHGVCPIRQLCGHAGGKGGSRSSGNRGDCVSWKRASGVIKDVVVTVSAYRTRACAGYIGVECQHAELEHRIGVEAFSAIRKVNIPAAVGRDAHSMISAGSNNLAKGAECGWCALRAGRGEFGLLHKRIGGGSARVRVDRYTWGCRGQQWIHDAIHGLQVRRCLGRVS